MARLAENPISVSTRHGHERCTFCGTDNRRSLRLSFVPGKDGAVRTAFLAERDLQGYDGLLHGGIIASLFDAAMTHCLFHRGIAAVTADLHVRYVRPIGLPVCLDVGAWILRCSPPLYRLRAEIVAGQDVMAWAEGKFMKRAVRDHRPSPE